MSVRWRTVSCNGAFTDAKPKFMRGTCYKLSSALRNIYAGDQAKTLKF